MITGNAVFGSFSICQYLEKIYTYINRLGKEDFVKYRVIVKLVNIYLLRCFFLFKMHWSFFFKFP